MMELQSHLGGGAGGGTYLWPHKLRSLESAQTEGEPQTQPPLCPRQMLLLCVCARARAPIGNRTLQWSGGEVKRAVLEPGPEIPAAPTFLSRAASLPEPAGGSTTLRLCPSAFPVARLYIRLSQGNRGTARQSESVNQNRRPVRRPRPSRLVRSQPDHAPGVDWGGRCGSLRPRSGAGEEVRR